MYDEDSDSASDDGVDHRVGDCIAASFPGGADVVKLQNLRTALGDGASWPQASADIQSIIGDPRPLAESDLRFLKGKLFPDDHSLAADSLAGSRWLVRAVHRILSLGQTWHNTQIIHGMVSKDVAAQMVGAGGQGTGIVRVSDSDGGALVVVFQDKGKVTHRKVLVSGLSISSAGVETDLRFRIDHKHYAGIEFGSIAHVLRHLADRGHVLRLVSGPLPEDPAVSAAAPPPPPLVADPCNTTAKFTAGRTMIVGQPVAATRGIWATLGIEQGGEHFITIMSNGVGEITREFTTMGEHCNEQDKARFDYICTESASLLVQSNGVKRDVGNEGLTLDDFVKDSNARNAQLTKAHVLALRLYTSNSYVRINGPMRIGCTVDNPHPFAATAFYIYDGIMKLRATRAGDATAVRVFWRGMEDMDVTEEFLERGGTEMACVSTTPERTVARKFAKVGEVANPLLIKVESTSLMDCGADISWLSMYPEEKEVLFPPLTYLRPVSGPVIENGCTVITVQPQFG